MKIIKTSLNVLGVIALISAIITTILWWVNDQPQFEPVVTTFSGISGLVLLIAGWIIPKEEESASKERLPDNIQPEANDSKIRKDIFSKLCAYHKVGKFKNMTVSRVIDWFGHKYKEENIKEELQRMEQDKIIKLDNSDPIGPATGITLLKNHY